jgi:alkylresorcinol/alkylpyrone synthase
MLHAASIDDLGRLPPDAAPPAVRPARATLRSLSTSTPLFPLPAGDATRLEAGGPTPEGAEAYRRLVERSRVAQRTLSLPPEEVLALGGASHRAPLYERAALDLAERAGRDAIAAAGVDPRSIGVVVSASCTGYVLPSVDAHLVDRLGLDPGVRRLPITQLGCSAGVGTLAIASDLLAARGGRALVVCVEPSSLCVQAADPDASDLVGNALFGDAGAAAILDADPGHPDVPSSPSAPRDANAPVDVPVALGPSILRSACCTWPEHASLLGMRLTDAGPRLVLSPRLPEVLGEVVAPAVDAFLAESGLERRDLAFWAIHPGGPRILDAIGDALDLDDDALAPVWRAWSRNGNVVSATIFFILREIAATVAPPPGSLGLALAVGPGLSLELLLLRAGGWLSGE